MTDRLKTVYPPKTSFCGGYNELKCIIIICMKCAIFASLHHFLENPSYQVCVDFALAATGLRSRGRLRPVVEQIRLPRIETCGLESPTKYRKYSYVKGVQILF